MEELEWLIGLLSPACALRSLIADCRLPSPPARLLCTCTPNKRGKPNCRGRGEYCCCLEPTAAGVTSSFLFHQQNQYKSQGNKLIPDSPDAQALMYQRMFEAFTLVEKMMNAMYYNFKVPEGERHDSAIHRNKEAMTAELKLWEGYLKKTNCCLAGQEFTLADVLVYPFIAYMFHYGLSSERYPALAKYYNSLKDRPSIKATWPPYWQKYADQDALKTI
uniref:Glutathione S-transferase rho n=1 Tax=Acanthochromis polyacanthus TaxID=80966 RepID=A0A3Q1FU29_9TELE